MQKHLLIAALALVLPALPALADPGDASAVISNLTWTLVNLRPDDGITPSITFEAQTGSSHATFGASPGIYHSDYHTDSAQLVVDQSVARSSQSGRMATANSHIQPGPDSYIDAEANNQWAITITPWTKVVFGADATVDGMHYPALGVASFGRAAVCAYHAGGRCLPKFVVANVPSIVTSWQGPLSSHVTTEFSNATDQTDTGTVSLLAYAYSYDTPVTPVPEPAELGMMVAGLGIFGLLAKRRKSL